MSNLERFYAERDERRRVAFRFQTIGFFTFVIGLILSVIAAIVLNVFQIHPRDVAYLWITLPVLIVVLVGFFTAYVSTLLSAA